MVKMDANQRQGAVAEMRVALALVEHGCAVNSMTQMDFGTDLNVQVPDAIPAPGDAVWEMTQRTANLQIKSSRSARGQATVSHALADSWATSYRRVSPTFLILSVRDDYYAFDTARIRQLAARALAVRRQKLMAGLVWEDAWGDPPGLEETTVSFSAANGLRTTIDELPRLIVYWTLNAAELDNLARLDVDLSRGLGPQDPAAALRFVQLAVAAYATAFFDYERYKHFASGGSEETYALASNLLEAAFGGPHAGRAEATRVVSSIPITAQGWAPTPPLHLFTGATQRQAAAESLIELATKLTRYA